MCVCLFLSLTNTSFFSVISFEKSADKRKEEAKEKVSE
jgi:hypothetical protein